jgi:hypothetical protein
MSTHTQSEAVIVSFRFASVVAQTASVLKPWRTMPLALLPFLLCDRYLRITRLRLSTTALHHHHHRCYPFYPTSLALPGAFRRCISSEPFV